MDRPKCAWLVWFRGLVVALCYILSARSVSCPGRRQSSLFFRPSPRLQLSSTTMQATAAYVFLVHVLLALAVASGNASNASPHSLPLSRHLPPHRRESASRASTCKTTSGVTALMRASIHGRTSTVRLMLDAKADASLQSIDGSTALMLAEYHNRTAAAQVLRQHAKRSTATAEARAAAVAAELLAEEAEDKDLSGACGTKHALSALWRQVDEIEMTDAEMVTAEYAAFMKGPDYYVTFRATAPILGWPFRGPWQQATGPIRASRDQGNAWKEATVDVHSPAFSFKYIRGNEYQGDAAVAQIARPGARVLSLRVLSLGAR